MTVTFALFQPYAFGAGVLVWVRTGGVLSMFMEETVVLAEFPALSVQAPLAD